MKPQPLPVAVLLAQRRCCGRKCQLCPYVPKHVAGSTQVQHAPKTE
jgi:hypothetical protein